MIAVQVIAVGRLKEAWMRDGCAEYVKRLGLWSRASVVEVDEYRLGENPSPAQIRVCVEKEGERILEKIPKGARVVAMCIEGKTLSSEGLADYLARAAASGAGRRRAGAS